MSQTLHKLKLTVVCSSASRCNSFEIFSSQVLVWTNLLMVCLKCFFFKNVLMFLDVLKIRLFEFTCFQLFINFVESLLFGLMACFKVPSGALDVFLNGLFLVNRKMNNKTSSERTSNIDFREDNSNVFKE